MNLLATHLFLMLFLVGIIFVIAGFILKKFPPKQINELYGYRSKASMKNQENWNFAQQYSSVKMMFIGGILMGISFLKSCFTFENSNYEIIFCLIVLALAVTYLIYSTEKAIQNKFPSNVN